MAYKDKAIIDNCKKVLRGGKKMASCCPGVAFATPCHPMATGLTLYVHMLCTIISRIHSEYAARILEGGV